MPLDVWQDPQLILVLPYSASFTSPAATLWDVHPLSSAPREVLALLSCLVTDLDAAFPSSPALSDLFTSRQLYTPFQAVSAPETSPLSPTRSNTPPSTFDPPSGLPSLPETASEDFSGEADDGWLPPSASGPTLPGASDVEGEGPSTPSKALRRARPMFAAPRDMEALLDAEYESLESHKSPSTVSTAAPTAATDAPPRAAASVGILSIEGSLPARPVGGEGWVERGSPSGRSPYPLSRGSSVRFQKPVLIEEAGVSERSFGEGVEEAALPGADAGAEANAVVKRKSRWAQAVCWPCALLAGGFSSPPAPVPETEAEHPRRVIKVLPP